MPIYVEMPKLSDTMTEGTLVRWLKKAGDAVEPGDVVAEVETDKATMEMEVFDPGTIHELLVKEGEKVPLGSRLYVLLEEGEAAPAAGAKPPAKAEKSKKDAPEANAAKEKTESSAIEAPKASANHERIKVSPLAKKIAASSGVDLSGLSGTGPGGRIIRNDVESAGKKPAPTTAKAPAAQPVSVAENRHIPLSGMRRVIAERLLESKRTIPHFYQTIEIDAAPMMALRAEIKSLGEATAKITVNDFVLRATALAAAAVPQANASFTGDAIIEYGTVNLAVAVAIDDGLVTPIVRNAQMKSLAELSAEVKDLAGRARNKKLKPDEYQGGSITVSNLGAFGIEEFCAIINPPQAVIVAVGAIVKKPVVNEANEIVVGQRMRLTLSADHRVVDGAVGAQLLAKLKEFLEKPLLLLV